MFTYVLRPSKLIVSGKKEAFPEKYPLYDLDEEDVQWLKALNNSRKNRGKYGYDIMNVQPCNC